MKIFIIAALLLLTAPPLSAEQGDAAPVDPHTKCLTYSQLAESIMQARQEGVPMSTVMEILLPIGGKLAPAMVTLAYEEPRWGSEDLQQMAIANFRDENYLACFRASNK